MIGRDAKTAPAADAGKRGGGGLGPRKIQVIVLGAMLVFLVISYVVVLKALQPQTGGREVSITRLAGEARDGSLRDLTILRVDSRIVATTEDGEVLYSGLLGEVQSSAVAERLVAQGVNVSIDSQTDKQLLQLATQYLLPAATLIVGFAFLFVIFRGISGGELSLFGRSRARRYQPGATPPVTLADVAGQDEAVQELREVQEFLVDPSSFEAIGARTPKGILLVGPPGCGKTLIARAVAGEAGVAFFSISATEFVEMLVGVGAARVRDLFAQARLSAPSIVFIDEIDAIGRERSSGDAFNVEWEASLNELLVQLDGFDPSDRVVLMAATNRADILDSALVRKGRFDRQVVIDLPDLAGRIAIFKIHSRGRPLDQRDLEALAHRTAGFSGADIANVLNEAALLAGRRRLQRIGRRELDEAVERVIAGPERRSRVLGEEEKRRVAYHEAGHAVVGWALRPAGSIDKVSIVARGHSLGTTWHLPPHDRQLTTRSELEREIAFRLAGRAAEELVYGDPSNGAQDDLERATRLAHAMVCDYGMSRTLGPRVLQDDARGGARSIGDALAQQADAEIGTLLTEAEGRCHELLAAYREQLDRVAETLVRRETLEREDLASLLRDIPDVHRAETEPSRA
ncbi:MAG: ATP-dependent zinc metalloprotease FtsH [Solirubrobacterales bacterium]|nr:ATP-dependent zinc metalloprotease FtsH [Solirubrobacterales bacterium]